MMAIADHAALCLVVFHQEILGSEEDAGEVGEPVGFLVHKA